MAILKYKNSMGNYEPISSVNNNLATADGILPITKGGTGKTTAPEALAALGGVSKNGDTINGDLTVDNLTVSGNINASSGIAGFCGMTANMQQNLGAVNTTGDAQIKLDTVIGSYGNISLNSYAINIQEPGYYFVSGQIMFNEGVANKYMGLTIRKNGSFLLDAYYSMGSVNYGCVNVSGSIYRLNAGDKLTLFARIPSAGIVINGNSRSNLSVFRIF